METKWTYEERPNQERWVASQMVKGAYGMGAGPRFFDTEQEAIEFCSKATEVSNGAL